MSEKNRLEAQWFGRFIIVAILTDMVYPSRKSSKYHSKK